VYIFEGYGATKLIMEYLNKGWDFEKAARN